jgi:hypothetical protein
MFPSSSISGLVVKFPLAMREPRVRFPADAFCQFFYWHVHGTLRVYVDDFKMVNLQLPLLPLPPMAGNDER